MSANRMRNLKTSHRWPTSAIDKGQWHTRRPPRRLQCPTGLQQLRKRCLQSIGSYHTEGNVVNTPDGMYVYRDNGASVLAVAHLDTVQPGPRHFGSPPGQPDVVYNAQLDDRLGAYTILNVLPAMGIKVDTLLTEGEESCRSTAAHFWPDKPYNWLIEFDRAGQDVVLYDYETEELVKLLTAAGNDVQYGTYSDISAMEHLGVAGFNWGIGSYCGHFPNAHFKIPEYIAALKRFNRFYQAYKDRQFEHIPYMEEEGKDPWGYQLEEYRNGKWVSPEDDDIYWEHRRELEWKEAFAETYYR